MLQRVPVVSVGISVIVRTNEGTPDTSVGHKV